MNEAVLDRGQQGTPPQPFDHLLYLAAFTHSSELSGCDRENSLQSLQIHIWLYIDEVCPPLF